MFRVISCVAAVGLGLAGCAEMPSAEVDPLTAALAGNTIVGDRARINVNADGTLTGAVGPNLEFPVEGTWTIRDGQWCRTFTTAPEALRGTSCQDATLNDNGTLTVSGVDSPSTFDII